MCHDENACTIVDALVVSVIRLRSYRNSLGEFLIECIDVSTYFFYRLVHILSVTFADPLDYRVINILAPVDK